MCKISPFNEASRRDQRCVQGVLQHGHVLVQEVGVVAGHQPLLEGVVRAPARGAPVVVHDRLRLVEVAVAIDLRAVAEVDVLEIAEMPLVEVPDLLDHVHPVHRRTRARGEDPSRLVISVRRLSFSSGKSPSQRTIVVSGVIDLPRIPHGQHLRLNGKRPRIPHERLIKPLDAVSVDRRVVVQKKRKTRPREHEAGVRRVGKAGVPLQLQQPDAGIILFYDLTAFVRRPVVDDDHLRLATSRQNRVEARREEFLTVVIRDDDCDQFSVIFFSDGSHTVTYPIFAASRQKRILFSL